MIEVKIIETEFDEKTGKVIDEKMTARYTGEYARRYLRTHPEVYDNNSIYDGVDDEAFYHAHEFVEVK